MPLSELLPAVNDLSLQDKLWLIHFLLVAVAKEEGCELEITNHQTQEDLLNQLASTEAVVWSPYEAHEADQTLLDLLMATRQEENTETPEYPLPQFYGCIQDETFFRHPQGQQPEHNLLNGEIN